VLRGAFASERFVAFGRPHTGAEHKAIETTLFMDPSVEITWWNTVETETHGKRFDDVQLRTAQVLAW